MLKTLETHFRFKGEGDGLPHQVKGRRKGQNGRDLLARVMRDLGFQVGAEVGTRFGDSAKLWCETMPGLKLTCIHPYEAYPSASQRRQDVIYAEATKKSQTHGFKLLRERSLDAVDRFEDESLDFVHIDGDHSFNIAVQDIIRYVPKVKKGGLVLVHDYLNFFQAGVVQAVDGYTTCHAIRPWFVTHDLEPTAFWQRGAEQVP